MLSSFIRVTNMHYDDLESKLNRTMHEIEKNGGEIKDIKQFVINNDTLLCILYDPHK